MPRKNEQTHRKCIATGQVLPVDELLRFVAGPNDELVVDLKRSLPGRGVWVSAEKNAVETARRRQMFARALKSPVKVAADLTGTVDDRLLAALTGAISMARKAGQLVNGFTRVEQAILSGRAAAILHASDAADDGVRKLRSVLGRMKPRCGGILVINSLRSDQLSLAFGGSNVIHAALLDGQASGHAIRCAGALESFRGPDRQCVIGLVNDSDRTPSSDDSVSQD
jgi:predicted RNA-binding protein YlxR (DUF448 family)